MQTVTDQLLFTLCLCKGTIWVTTNRFPTYSKHSFSRGVRLSVQHNLISRALHRGNRPASRKAELKRLYWPPSDQNLRGSQTEAENRRWGFGQTCFVLEYWPVWIQHCGAGFRTLNGWDCDSFLRMSFERDRSFMSAALQFHVLYKGKVKAVTWPGNPGDLAQRPEVKVRHLVLLQGIVVHHFLDSSYRCTEKLSVGYMTHMFTAKENIFTAKSIVL